MQNIGRFILKVLENQGRKQKWLYEQYVEVLKTIGEEPVGYKAFNRKINEDKLSAKELVIIATILDCDLNKIKCIV